MIIKYLTVSGWFTFTGKSISVQMQ